MFFSNNDTEQKRKLALLNAVLLIFKANTNPLPYIKIGQDSFIRTLSRGLSNNPLFISRAESMDYIEVTSILRNCNNFYKRSYAQTLSSAFGETGNSIEAREILKQIAKDCDIPRNYFNIQL